jgi:hypothetical protein
MVDTDHIKIRQNRVEEEAESYAVVATEVDSDTDGFVLLGAVLLLGCPLDEIDPEDIVDGGEDKQIDFIYRVIEKRYALS